MSLIIILYKFEYYYIHTMFLYKASPLSFLGPARLIVN